jgi:hypothetical protein
MHKWISLSRCLALCCLALGLSGCATAKHDPEIRARDDRPYPNPTLGTANAESQWYKTQTIAPPSPAGAAPVSNAPAKLPKKTVPTRARSNRATPSGTVQVAKPSL